LTLRAAPVVRSLRVLLLQALFILLVVPPLVFVGVIWFVRSLPKTTTPPPNQNARPRVEARTPPPARRRDASGSPPIWLIATVVAAATLWALFAFSEGLRATIDH
jgi:hypothetical protein